MSQDRTIVGESGPSPDSPGRSVAVGEGHDQPEWARWWIALAGLLAGLAAFGIGEMVHELIPAAKEEVNTMGRLIMLPTVKTTSVAGTWNGALTFGLFGVCLGGLLGMAGGLARRSGRAILVAGLLGAILGLTVGAGVSFAVLPLFFHAEPLYPQYELILSISMHGSIWGLTGAAAGMAFAVGLGQRRMYGRALAAGFVGGVLGAIAFDLIGVLLFPLGNTGEPISTTWPTRLTARLLVALATTAFVILLLPERKTPTRPRSIP